MQTKQKHTSGPWTLKGDETPWTCGDAQTAIEEEEELGHTEILFSLNNPDDEPMAYLVWEPLASPERCEELRANAQLIATAPELLVALESLKKAVEDAHVLDIKKRLDLCVATAVAGTAIVKATGR